MLLLKTSGSLRICYSGPLCRPQKSNSKQDFSPQVCWLLVLAEWLGSPCLECCILEATMPGVLELEGRFQQCLPSGYSISWEGTDLLGSSVCVSGADCFTDVLCGECVHRKFKQNFRLTQWVGKNCCFVLCLPAPANGHQCLGNPW